MAITNGYTTLANFKAYTGISSTDTNDDALIETLVERASRVIDAHTRRRFFAESETRYYDAVGPHIDGRLLFLDKDLVSVTTLTNGDGDEIGSDDYVLEPANTTPAWGLKLKSDAGVSWTYSGASDQAISVAGSWGYNATGSYPADIEHVCLRLAGMFYRQKDTLGPIDQVAVSAVGVPLIPGGMPRDVRQMLKPYRRHDL